MTPLPTFLESEEWTLAFHTTTPYRIVKLLTLGGRYKHVSAFTYVPALRLWQVYDVSMQGSHLLLLPDSQTAVNWLADRVADADLVKLRRRPAARPPLAPFTCVAAIKHLMGLRCGALRPDGLWRHCQKIGEVVHDGQAAPDGFEPGADPAGAASAAGQA